MDSEDLKEAANKLTPSEQRTTVVVVAVFLLLLIVVPLAGCPTYHVWEQHMKGEAELARAESNRKVLIAQSKATRLAAAELAASDTIRAHGEARSNEIIGNSLAGERGAARLRYLWIQGLENGNNRETIYIPTEAGLPITEASRRRLSDLP